MRKTDPILLA